MYNYVILSPFMLEKKCCKITTVLKGKNNIANPIFIQVTIILNMKLSSCWSGKILESVYCSILLLIK